MSFGETCNRNYQSICITKTYKQQNKVVKYLVTTLLQINISSC